MHLTTLTNVHQIVAFSRLRGYPDTRSSALFPLAAQFCHFEKKSFKNGQRITLIPW